MDSEVRRRLFTVADYYRMADVGILNEDDRVELIGGEVVEMPPITPLRASVSTRVHYLFMSLAREHIVSVRNPVRLDEFNEPAPDLALLKWKRDFHRSAHPGPPDVFLLVEVADSSLDYDRDLKAPLYSRFSIGEFWVDARSESVEIYREPSRSGYQSHQIARVGESVSPLALPDVSIPASEILG